MQKRIDFLKKMLKIFLEINYSKIIFSYIVVVDLNVELVCGDASFLLKRSRREALFFK
jgi:hypothetical protein